MSYIVKEMHLTLQGEGANVGRVMVLTRFSGCNLWSGREEDRGSGCSAFCDTDFRGGTRYETATSLADAIEAAWGDRPGKRWALLTGGEPLLQVDDDLLYRLRLGCSIFVAIETNGTRPLPSCGGVDWVCVSPKSGGKVVLDRADEVKIVYPTDVDPRDWVDFPASHHWLSPLWVVDTTEREQNMRGAVEYCLRDPQWRLSIQSHKVLGVP